MVGKRVVDWTATVSLEPGEYAKYPDGTWYACTPNDMLANLKAHQVTEHEDGTISVQPSILTTRTKSGESEPYMK